MATAIEVKKERLVMDTKEAIAKAIEVAAFRKKITQESIAKTAGISPTSMYRKLNGLSDFRIKEIDAISKALGFKTTWDFIDFVKAEERLSKKMPAAATTGTQH